MTRVALLDRLQELQQMPKFQNRDIRTISALRPVDDSYANAALSNEALAKHVEVCEAAADAPSRFATHDERSGRN